MSARTAFCLVAAIITTAVVTLSAASSPWTATILKAPGGIDDINGSANSVHGNQIIGQAGTATYIWTYNNGVWDAVAGSAIQSEFAGVDIYSGRVVNQLGNIWGWDSSQYPNDVPLSLQVGNSVVRTVSISGDSVAGYVGDNLAIWTLSTAPSFTVTYLPRANNVGSVTDELRSTDGQFTAGYHLGESTQRRRATRWANDGSGFVDYHPGWAHESAAWDVHSQMTVGWVSYEVDEKGLVGSHAAVWDQFGNLELLDPQPQVDSDSQVRATHQNIHVGYADGGVKAMNFAYTWTTGPSFATGNGGNPISLHSVLQDQFGSQFVESVAFDVYVQPGKITVCGVALESNGQARPIVWTRLIDCDCPADFAEPFCVLNFFDLSTFLALFNAQDPAADLAAPSGVWNFFDVAAFLGHFNQGCIPE